MPDLAEIAIASEDLSGLILTSSRPVIVDFWAPWCGTCRLMTPNILRLARELGDTLRVVSLNVETAQDVALAYNVTSLPTLLIFRGSSEVKRLNGMKSYTTLSQEIATVLN